MDEATKQWFDAEFQRITAGRVPLISLENIHYVYAEPAFPSSGIEEISSVVDATMSNL